MQILALIRDRFAQALVGWVDDPEEHVQRITPARDARHGDYQANIAMPLQKALGRKPQEIAQQIIDKLSIDDICHPPEIAGPGFINLRLRDDFLARQLETVARDARQGVTTVVQSRTFVIDYSAPNVAKPMHVGHIRSTVIGDALARVLRFLGHRVISDNHLGDWGTQFGMIIYGYKHFVDEAAFETEPVAELSRLYRLVQQLIGYQSAIEKLPAAEQKLQFAREKLAQATTAAQSDAAKKKELKSTEKEVAAATEVVQALTEKIDAVAGDVGLKALAIEHPQLEQCGSG
ncbi:MAG: arginine--tRNA ligase [Pirellulaceae bacterium]